MQDKGKNAEAIGRNFYMGKSEKIFVLNKNINILVQINEQR